MSKDKKSKIKDEIDHNLKLAFDQIQSEGVPDRFADLLNALREKDARDAGETRDKDD